MAPSDALLYPIAGRVDYDERRAIYWVPNERTEKEIVGLPDDVNSRRVRKLHRIAVCSDYGDIELAFAIRHELEHARQIECHGRELGELHGLIEDMLRGESNALAPSATISLRRLFISLPTSASPATQAQATV